MILLVVRKSIEETLNGMGRDEVKLLSVDKLLEILQNPVFFSLQGKRLYKEQQFLVSLPVRTTYAKKEGADEMLLKDSGEEMIFQGAVDLLALGEDGEGYIIDYKYSRSNAKHLCERYAPQLDLYRQAVAKIMKIPLEKIKCSIVNIYHGFQVDLD